MKDRGSIKSENGESSESRSHMNGKVRKVWEKLNLYVVDEEQPSSSKTPHPQIEMLLDFISSSLKKKSDQYTGWPVINYRYCITDCSIYYYLKILISQIFYNKIQNHQNEADILVTSMWTVKLCMFKKISQL